MASLNVIVADDEGGVRESVCEMLCAAGHTACAAVASGEEAVEQATLGHADVVLMDVRMPGIGGIEAARRISALPNPVPVVFLTVEAEPDVVEQAVEAGGYGYLVKPFHGHQLGPALQGAVHRFREWQQASGRRGPEAAGRQVVDGLSRAARSTGLDSAVAAFLAAIGAQLPARGLLVAILGAGEPAPTVPTTWGEEPPRALRSGSPPPLHRAKSYRTARFGRSSSATNTRPAQLPAGSSGTRSTSFTRLRQAVNEAMEVDHIESVTPPCGADGR